jgi:hypothetical protein
MESSLGATPQQRQTVTGQTTLDRALPRQAERARHLEQALSDPQSRSAAAAAADGNQPAGTSAPSVDSTTPAQPAPAPTPTAPSPPPSENPAFKHKLVELNAKSFTIVTTSKASVVMGSLEEVRIRHPNGARYVTEAKHADGRTVKAPVQGYEG